MTVKAFGLESKNASLVYGVFNNRDVLVIGVNGCFGGVNADVYTAVPFTIRKFDI